MYVSSGASNSFSSPLGPMSLILYTAIDALKPGDDFKRNDFETLFTDPSENGFLMMALLIRFGGATLTMQGEDRDTVDIFSSEMERGRAPVRERKRWRSVVGFLDRKAHV